MNAQTLAQSADANLNGLDPQQLVATARGLADNPAQAAISFAASTTWKGGFRTSTAIGGYELAGTRIPRRHRVDTDEPREVFGGDSAPNPQDLLLAALNSCMTVGFVVEATTRGIALEELHIESALALDLRGAFGVDPNVQPGAQCIRYTIRVKGRGTREQFEDIHREVVANSPNRYHLAQPIAFVPELVLE